MNKKTNQWGKNEFYDEMINFIGKERAKLVKVEKVNYTYSTIITENQRVHPVMDLETLYEKYKDYEDGPLYATSDLLHEIESADSMEINVDDIMKKENIRMGIISKCRNEHLLEKYPYMEKEDLMIFFMFEDDEYNVKITYKLMESMGMDLDMLYKTAYENLVKSGFRVTIMNNLMKALGEDIGSGNDMYIIESKDTRYGASCVLCEKFLESVSLKLDWEKFYILPSSIYECIIIPFHSDSETSYLKKIVKDINDNVVDFRVVLSDNVYVYDIQEKDFRLA